MPIDVGDVKAKYQAQSDINADLLADFSTANPDITVGAQFFDTNGLKWQCVGIFTYPDGNILPIAAWVNDSEVLTDYQQTDTNA